MLKRLFMGVMVLLAGCGNCSAARGVPVLVPRHHFGSDSLLSPVDIVWHRGRLYVLDRMSRTISVFTKSGEFLKKFGGGGQGPGEFQHPSRMDAVDGKLFVLDSGTRKISVFSTGDGHFMFSGRIQTQNDNAGPVDMGVSPLGDVILSWSGMHRGCLLIRILGYQRDRRVFSEVRKFFETPVAVEEQFRASKGLPDNDFFTHVFRNTLLLACGETSLYIVDRVGNRGYVYSLEGVRKGEFQLPFKGIRRVSAKRLPTGGFSFSNIRNYDVKVSGADVWVLSRNEHEQSVFSVFDDSGEMKDRILADRRLIGFDIAGDSMFCIDEDEAGVFVYPIRERACDTGEIR